MVTLVHNLGSKNEFVTVGSEEADYIVDGTADDVQIQAAIDAVSLAGGGVIHLRRFNYNTAATINLKSGVKLIGESTSGVLIKPEAVLNGPVILIDNVIGSGIHDVTIDGNVVLHPPAVGDNTNNGICFEGTTSGLVFDRVKVQNTGGNGFYSPDSAITNNILINNCETEATGTRGIYVQSDNVSIVGGEYHGSVHHDGVQFESAANGLVWGVRAYNNAAKGLECQVGSDKVQFIGCYSYNNGTQGVEVANGCTDIDFVSCYIYDNSGEGIRYAREAGNPCVGGIIDSCVVTNNGTGSGENGVDIVGCNKIRIVNTTVSGSARHGIIMQNSLDNGPSNYCEISSCSVFNNSRISTTGDGIAVYGDASNNLIAGNNVYDDQTTKRQRYGIQVNAATVQNTIIRFNELEGNLSSNYVDNGTDTKIDLEQSKDPGDGRWMQDLHNIRTAGAVMGRRFRVDFDSDAGNNDILDQVRGLTKIWWQVDGDGNLNAEGKMAIGTLADPKADLDLRSGDALIHAPATHMIYADISAGQIHPYQEETLQEIRLAWKDSAGSLFDRSIQLELIRTATKSSNFTSLDFALNPIDTIIGTTVIASPPTTPFPGLRFAIVDVTANAAVNNITVDFTGSTFYSAAGGTDVLDESGAYTTYQYIDATVGWVREK